MAKSNKAVRAEQNVRAIGESAYDSIVEMVATLDVNLEEDAEDPDQHILEDALEVTVTGEGKVGNLKPTGYRILLSTGGPASRIVGELDEHLQPETARLEVQDWFIPWTEYRCAEAPLLRYAQCFYFGDA